MTKYKKLTMPIALVMSLLLSAAACTKKRDPALPYGEDRDLQGISTYEGKEFDLQTFEKVKSFSSNSKLKITDSRKGEKEPVHAFDYVAYKAEDPLKLTDNTLMLGRPNHHYKIKYLFQSNALKVMKLAPAEDLSVDEQAAAIDNRDGRLMVPIVSYSISYYSIDKKRNDYNETTSKLELIPLQSPNGATHFKIDYNSKTRATFLSKATVLPSNFFEGEKGESSDWYFAYTIIGQNAKENLDNWGFHTGYDKYLRSANRVRARKLENKLIFFNLNIDERLQKNVDQRLENQSVAVTIPAEFVDYEFPESGKGTSVKEQVTKEKAWDQRSQVDLKVSEVQVPNTELNISELMDVQIGNGYFSFTVKSEKLAAVIRFSFYNVKAYQKDAHDKYGAEEYKPKIYFPDDKKVFGFFSTTQDRIFSQTPMLSVEDNRKNLADRRTFLKRSNPTRKIIEYRLNHDAPDWTEEIVKKAINGWNATLQKAGLALRLKVTDESGKVLRGQVGDLRYNMINMLTEADHRHLPWGGLGPSLSDTSGEIIMATANASVADKREGIRLILNAYFRSLKGDLDSKYLMGFSFPAMQVILQTATKQLQVIGSSLGLLDLGISLPIYDPVSRTVYKDFRISTDADAQGKGFSEQAYTEDSVTSVNKDIITAAQQLCPEVQKYAGELRDQKVQVTDQAREMKLINDCVPTLMTPSLLYVLSHEIGHNLGLLHNFYGSADVRNFFSATSTQIGDRSVPTQMKSSSVMEYPTDSYFDMITQPGRYDIAAIRWAYSERVESNSGGQLLTTDPNQPLKNQNLSSMRNFMYCTDDDVDIYSTDPMCAKNDKGSNPVEVVDYLIESYQANLATWTKRLGREKTIEPMVGSQFRFESYILPMRRFYEVWRLILKGEAGSGREYLENFDTVETYNELVRKALDPQVHGEAEALRNKQYFEASQKIFEFLTRIAFMPDYSCVTERTINGKNTLQLVSMSKIQLEIFNRTKSTFVSCQEKEVQDYLAATRNAKVIAEGGLSFANIYGDLENRETQLVKGSYHATDRAEIAGISQDRFFALSTLMERSKVMYSTRMHQFAPSFIDELPFREILEKKIRSRITNGVDLKDLEMNPNLGLKIADDTYSENFDVEKPFLNKLISFWKLGLSVPGKDSLTELRTAKFALRREYEVNGESDPECIDRNGHSHCATKEKNPESYWLIKQYKAVEKRRQVRLISDRSLKVFTDIVMPLIPKEGHAAEADLQVYEALKKKHDEIKDSDPILNQDIQSLEDTLLTEYGIFQQATNITREKLGKLDISKAEQDAKFTDLTKVKLVDLAKKIGNSTYAGLDQAELKKRVEELLAKQKAAYEEYQITGSELEAQADVLRNALFID